MTSIACLIPARMESQRYPGKALAIIEDQAMVIRCARNAMNAGLKTWVCTDSELIEHVCMQTSVRVIKTPSCSTGTDRCAWAIQHVEATHIIILQGDEPLVQPEALNLFREKVQNCNQPNILFNGVTELAGTSFSDLNVVKASCHRDTSINNLTRTVDHTHRKRWKRQMGLYGGSINSFINFAQLPATSAEQQNSIEMLRWIDHGHPLCPVELAGAPYSVDTPEDMKKCHSFLSEQRLLAGTDTRTKPLSPQTEGVHP